MLEIKKNRAFLLWSACTWKQRLYLRVFYPSQIGLKNSFCGRNNSGRRGQWKNIRHFPFGLQVCFWIASDACVHWQSLCIEIDVFDIQWLVLSKTNFFSHIFNLLSTLLTLRTCESNQDPAGATLFSLWYNAIHCIRVHWSRSWHTCCLPVLCRQQSHRMV